MPAVAKYNWKKDFQWESKRHLKRMTCTVYGELILWKCEFSLLICKFNEIKHRRALAEGRIWGNGSKIQFKIF